MGTLELLISEVQKRNVLWNKFNKKYRDRIACDKEWSIVARKTNLDKEDAKKKWRNLRDIFLKEKKKVKKCHSGDSQENAEIYTGKWMYYKLMLFLKDTTTPRFTEGNISDQEEIQEENSNLSEIDETENFSESVTENLSLSNNFETEQPESETESFITATSILSCVSSGSDISRRRSTKRKKKPLNKDFESKLLKIEEQKLTALLQSNVNPVATDDEDMLFLKSLHPYFHSLNPLQKLRIRNQIQTIFINELSTQVHQSPSLNETVSYASSTPSHNQYSSQQILYQNIPSSNINMQPQINQTHLENGTYGNTPVPNFNF